MPRWAALQVRVPRHPKTVAAAEPGAPSARMETGKHRWDLGRDLGYLFSLGLVSLRGVRKTS